MQAVDHIEVRYRRADTVGAWTNITLPAGQNTVEIDGLERGLTYQVEARAVGTNGSPSAWVEVTHAVADATQLPVTPYGLAALSVADGVHLSWIIDSAQRADVQYEIQRTGDVSGAPDGSGWAFLTNVTAQAYTDGVTDRVLRWYKVRAVDFQGLATPFTDPVSSHNKSIDDGSAVGSLSSGLIYVSTDTTITISWDVHGVLTDKVNTTFGTAGSQALTGLTASTTYNAYPYWDLIAAAVNAVSTGGVGTPSWAHVGTDRDWTAEQNRQGHLAMTSAPFSMATVAAATGGGPPVFGGGSGGGDGGCLRWDVLVQERNRGVIRVGEVRRGDQLWCRAGWSKVVNDPEPKLHDMWAHVSTSNGVQGLAVTTGHPFEDADGAMVRGYDLTLQTLLRCPTGVTSPTLISLVRETAAKVPISLEAPHVFYASMDGVNWLETHNQLIAQTI